MGWGGTKICVGGVMAGAMDGAACAFAASCCWRAVCCACKALMFWLMEERASWTAWALVLLARAICWTLWTMVVATLASSCVPLALAAP